MWVEVWMEVCGRCGEGRWRCGEVWAWKTEQSWVVVCGCAQWWWWMVVMVVMVLVLVLLLHGACSTRAAWQSDVLHYHLCFHSSPPSSKCPHLTLSSDSLA